MHPRSLLAMLVYLSLAAADPDKPAAREAEKVITNSIGMKLVLVSPGKFQMGSPADELERETDELLHEVEISRPFYLGVHEVTQDQYQKVTGKNPAFFTKARGGDLDHPVEQIRWGEAVEFCRRLSALDEEKRAGRTYRLPTEAEWEYACRAGNPTPFHFGKSLSSKQANCNGNSPYGGGEKGPYLQRTSRVGSYPPNAWGLHDMHGNVWEWCSDWYDEQYYGKGHRIDPPGPAQGVLPTGFGEDFYKVVRGGCWLDEARGCRSAYRFRFMTSDTYRLVGLRVVCKPVAKAP